MACHLSDLDTDCAIYLLCILLRLCVLYKRDTYFHCCQHDGMYILMQFQDVTEIRTAPNNKWWCPSKSGIERVGEKGWSSSGQLQNPGTVMYRQRSIPEREVVWCSLRFCDSGEHSARHGRVWPPHIHIYQFVLSEYIINWKDLCNTFNTKYVEMLQLLDMTALSQSSIPEIILNVV